MKKKVLFLCTGNSCRSQLAEALLRKYGSDKFESYSAGSNPYKSMEKFPETKGVHPLALLTLQTNNCSTDNLYSKSWDVYKKNADDFEYVFTLCGSANNEMSSETCVFFPGKAIRAHWGVDDPDKARGTEEEIKIVFKEAYDIIEKRVKMFVSLDLNNLTKQKIQEEVNKIGNTN